MKEKSKKIVIIILFVLFVFSAICLIGSCSLKTKSSLNNKLATASSPKNAFYIDYSNKSINSNNLLKNVGSSYIYDVKSNTSNYNTTNFIQLDTISAYTRNYFGGDRLMLDIYYYNLGTENVDFYIYLSNTRYTSKSQLPTTNYTRYTFYVYSGDTQGSPRHIEWRPSVNHLDLSQEIYVYMVTRTATNFNNSQICFTKTNAFTYYNTDTEERINVLKTFDYYGTFVPKAYNENTDKAINDSYDRGYSEGVGVGFDKGYLQGYSNGIDTAEHGDFNEMITAVADTPLKILYNFFNFEILGVNLWVFFTSILSILIVMFIIKKIK